MIYKRAMQSKLSPQFWLGEDRTSNVLECLSPCFSRQGHSQVLPTGPTEEHSSAHLRESDCHDPLGMQAWLGGHVGLNHDVRFFCVLFDAIIELDSAASVSICRFLNSTTCSVPSSTCCKQKISFHVLFPP